VSTAEQPLVEVVRGHASDEEMAALTAVISALLARRQQAEAAQTAARHPAQPGWPDRAALLRGPLITGPGAWRHSARPR
jgi:predicted negative regulator of RcsB-dependent stress response